MDTLKKSLIAWCFITAFLGSKVEAKLTYESLDYFVNKSNLIVEGVVVKIYKKGNKDLVTIQVDKFIFGHENSQLDVISYTENGWVEDEPTYQIGDRAIYFLYRPDKKSNYYDCVHGFDGKVDIKSDTLDTFCFPTNKDAFVKIVEQFLPLKTTKSKKGKIKHLIELLNTDDTFILTAACNWLNLTVYGKEDEDWHIQPPSEDNDWDYSEYYDKNAYYEKEKWKKWWKNQNKANYK